MRDWKKRIFLVMTCVCGPVLAQDDVPIRIEGVTSETKANLEAYLGKLTADDLLNWRDTHVRLKGAAREAMQSTFFHWGFHAW